MVVYAGLFRASLGALLDQVNKIRRTQFTEAWETLCAGVDSKADIVILNDPVGKILETSVPCDQTEFEGLTLALLAQAWQRTSMGGLDE